MRRVFVTVSLAIVLAVTACSRERNSDKSGSKTDSVSLAKTEEIISTESGDSTRYIFRKTNWGMTQKEVIASEGIRPRLVDDMVMIYATTWRDRQTEITYYFDQGLLGMAEYSISDPGMRIEDYLDMYNGLRLGLIDKFGKPALDDYGKGGFSKITVGKSFVFKQSPTLWSRLANWELPGRGTEILLYMGFSTASDDPTKSCDLQYKSNGFNIDILTGESQ